MRSPTRWNRKWPDSITPAWIGPTATWYGVAAADRHGPRREVGIVVDERPQRLVSVEADAVEVVRLALVPAGGRREVDDRGHRAVAGRRRSRSGSRRRRRRAACARLRRRPSRGGRRTASRRRAPLRSSRGSSREPRRELVDEVAAGQPRRDASSAREQYDRDVGQRQRGRAGRAPARARGRRAGPTVVSISAWARPRKPSASERRGDGRGPVAARPGSRRRRSAPRSRTAASGGRPDKRRERDAHASCRAAGSRRATPRDRVAWPRAGTRASSGVAA